MENGSELGVKTAGDHRDDDDRPAPPPSSWAGVTTLASSSDTSTTGNSKVRPNRTIIKSTSPRYWLGL